MEEEKLEDDETMEEEKLEDDETIDVENTRGILRKSDFVFGKKIIDIFNRILYF